MTVPAPREWQPDCEHCSGYGLVKVYDGPKYEGIATQPLWFPRWGWCGICHGTGIRPTPDKAPQPETLT